MIQAIFAVDHRGGMGFNGTLPWPHNKIDLGRFQQATNDHVVVMGRKTWDDPKMPKPLRGRIVYVASNRPVSFAGKISGNIVEEVLKLEQHHPDKIIWVIGGPAMIQECRELFDRIYLTYFKGSFKVDTKIDLETVLRGFVPVRANVARDFNSTQVIYESIFKRIKTSP